AHYLVPVHSAHQERAIRPLPVAQSKRRQPVLMQLMAMDDLDGVMHEKFFYPPNIRKGGQWIGPPGDTQFCRQWKATFAKLLIHTSTPDARHPDAPAIGKLVGSQARRRLSYAGPAFIADQVKYLILLFHCEHPFQRRVSKITVIKDDVEQRLEELVRMRLYGPARRNIAKR